MPEKNIELELRAEMTEKEFRSIQEEKMRGKALKSHSKRLSVMFLGSIGGSSLDIRVRIKKGAGAELVCKKGHFHAVDRVETSQKIEKGQFVGLVKIMANFGFSSKVTERETWEYDLGEDIFLAIVRSEHIYYMEIEKMSSTETVAEDRKKLEAIMSELRMTAIGKEDFDTLCQRLTDETDWKFSGDKESLAKLEEKLSHY